MHINQNWPASLFTIGRWAKLFEEFPTSAFSESEIQFLGKWISMKRPLDIVPDKWYPRCSVCLILSFLQMADSYSFSSNEPHFSCATKSCNSGWPSLQSTRNSAPEAYLVATEVFPTSGSPTRAILNCRSVISSSESDMTTTTCSNGLASP